MKRVSILISLISLSLVALVVSPAFAQVERTLEGYDDYYDKGKFDSLAGEDGIITEEDWVSQRNSKEEKAFGNYRWEQASKYDADGDGALDLNEAKAYKQAEKQALKNNSKALPALYRNEEWVKKHPEVAEKLIENRKWLNDNPKAAQAIYKDRKWLDNHPGVAKKAYKNREFLDKHPEFSKDAYRHNEQLKKNPKAVRQMKKDATKNPDKAKKIYKAGKKNPKAVRQMKKDATRNPDKAKKVYKAGKKHPKATKKSYKASKKHPKASKKAYKAGKKNPKASKRKAKKVYNRRRNK